MTQRNMFLQRQADICVCACVFTFGYKICLSLLWVCVYIDDDLPLEPRSVMCRLFPRRARRRCNYICRNGVMELLRQPRRQAGPGQARPRSGRQTSSEVSARYISGETRPCVGILYQQKHRSIPHNTLAPLFNHRSRPYSLAR